MNFLRTIAAILSFQILFSFGALAEEKNVLHQVSTIDALLGGVLDGEVDFKTLKQNGDFGIGTFDGLDGEMLAFDGKFYQIKSDGSVADVPDDMKTPFSSLTFFKTTQKMRFDEPFEYQELSEKLDIFLPSENLIYAVRIDGVFEFVKTRSVPKQNKPYPNLSEVVKTQPLFEFHQAKGTVVGFRFPKYMKGLNVPGYHFHFITEDRKGGGHVLDWKIRGAEIKVAEIYNFKMELPHNHEFYKIDLAKDRKAELATVEQHGK